jgi:hypothetical protein
MKVKTRACKDHNFVGEKSLNRNMLLTMKFKSMVAENCSEESFVMDRK